MTKRVGFLLSALAALLVLIAFLVPRPPAVQKPEAVKTNGLPVVVQVPTNSVPAPAAEAESNRVSVPPFFLTEANRFIAAATPYGLDKPIKPEDVIGVSDDGRRFMFETKTHLIEFFTKGRTVPQLHYFIATQDASNPVAEPEAKREAMKKWYQATAKWSKEAAVAETYRIMERLGMHFDVSRFEVDAPVWTVKNPQGENVQVTPFYKVELYKQSGGMGIQAEFRVGESGLGRLTTWWANVPPNAQ